MDNLVGDAVGVTEEVLAFAMNIAYHPETWLDFPLEEEDEGIGWECTTECSSYILISLRLFFFGLAFLLSSFT